VDGNDPLAVYNLTLEAVEKCRQGKGPILIEAKTYRHMGHHVNDPGKYMPADRLAYYKERDPVDRARNALIEMSNIDKSVIDAIEAEIKQEFDNAVEFSKASGEVTLESFRQFVDAY
jgi:pyruvate dehydrogenase E1 component alpha subunit